METGNDAHVEEVQSKDLEEAKNLSNQLRPQFSNSKQIKLSNLENRQDILVPNNGGSLSAKISTRASFFQNIHLLQKRIPKHLVSLDEKYLRRCLQLIHITASESSRCELYVEKSFPKIEIAAYHFDSAVVTKHQPFHSARLVFEYPLSANPRNVVVTSSGPLVGETMVDNKNMLQVMKSPLLPRLGAIGENRLIRSRLNDPKYSAPCSLASSPVGFSGFSPVKRGKETAFQQNKKQGSEKTHRRLASTSSKIPLTNDLSSYSSSPAVSEGMLHVKWMEGFPHFVFSFDEHGEVYSAQSCSADSASDCLYTFHMSKSNRKKFEPLDGQKSQLVGKMKVSESFSLCPNNSRIVEREFVLFACNVSMQTSYQNARRNKTLPKKVLEAFRNSHSRNRSMSKFDGRTRSTLDYCLFEPSQGVVDELEAQDRPQSSDNDTDLPPNHEIAAVVLKDHLPDKEPQLVGGWGMKFLKTVSSKQSIDDAKSLPCCAHDRNVGSVIMNAIVPMGLHGGPITRNGGPLGLIERWKSGGSCDCGGWDLGCPLTMFKSQSKTENAASPTAIQGECNVFELFLEGSQAVSAGLRIVNVHEGLYFVQFLPRLSALQSFSIAVAYIIHNQGPTLRNIPRSWL